MVDNVKGNTVMRNTVDREIFTLKIIHSDEFLQFHSIHEILTVDGYNMDERH